MVQYKAQACSPAVARLSFAQLEFTMATILHWQPIRAERGGTSSFRSGTKAAVRAVAKGVL